MKLLVLTMRYPYGSQHEVFFEPELRALAQAFEDVTILPMKAAAGRRALPSNVKCWRPLASHGRWLYVLGLLNPTAWKTLARLLSDCFKGGRLGWPQLRSSIVAACFDLAMRRHRGLNELLKSPDLVVYSYWGAIPALCLPLAKAKGAATCSRYHGVDLYLERQENAGYIPFRREVQAATDLNVFVSEQGKDYFAYHADAKASGEQVVARLGSPDFGPPLARPSTRSPDEPIVIVSVSQIVPVKRVHLIARLAKSMAQERRVEWHHFGSGHSQLLENELANIPSGLAVKMHGATENSDIQSFYRRTSVALFANLSESEGLPVSVMEALNADIPAVAANVGGTSEVVIDGRSGMLVPPDQCEASEALAARVLNALGEGGLLLRCSPREIWNRYCDAAQNSASFASLLRGLTAR
ncbi:glycosyltransferase [Devosia insulae]|uniref:glycosyltransferase n=1 Tax=Devosia insulae TaxID=408174 RepID=UPI00159F1FB8|nr:glycosyltransferase [Devosia insulae]